MSIKYYLITQNDHKCGRRPGYTQQSCPFPCSLVAPHNQAVWVASSVVGGMESVKNANHHQLVLSMRGHRPMAWIIVIYCLLPRLVRSGGGSGLLVGLAKVVLYQIHQNITGVH